MTFDEALNILGITENYTEEELKRKYHYLIKQYHPDNSIDKTKEELIRLEEKTKDINYAYEYLIKNADSKNKINLENYQIHLQKKLKEYCGNKYKYLSSYNAKISDLISEFAIKKFFTKKEIDDAYEEKLKEIKEIFKQLKNNYFQENAIDNKYDDSILDYECNLNEFYNQLEKIKEEHIDKSIHEEIIKYNNYSGYDYLKKLIETNYISNYKTYFKNLSFEESINKMNQEITELFELYFKVKKILNEVGNFLTESQNKFDESYTNRYYEILKDFENFKSLPEVMQSLNQLKNEISRINEVNDKKNILELLFQKIINKYNEKVKNYQISEDTTLIFLLTKRLELIIKMFLLAKSGQINLESIMLLENITFEDNLKDANILASINENLTMIATSNVYIGKNFSASNTNNWYVLSEKDGQLIMKYSDLSLKEQNITEQKLVEDYIQLEKFISNMKICGRAYNYSIIGQQLILYTSNTHYISVDDNNKIVIGIIGNLFESKLGKQVDIPKEYENKEYLKIKIIEMIQNKFDDNLDKSIKRKFR